MLSFQQRHAKQLASLKDSTVPMFIVSTNASIMARSAPKIVVDVIRYKSKCLYSHCPAKLLN